MSEKRYTVHPIHAQGAEVRDATRGGLPVAWCGDAFSVGRSGSFRVDGFAEAERIARLLNAASKPRSSPR